MKYSKLFALLFLATSLMMFVACGESTSDSGGEQDSTLNTDTTSVSENKNVPGILYSLPAPVDIASVLMDHPGAKFEGEMLNSPKNSTKYNTNKSLALNLGIYTADLSYAGFFEQQQITTEYMTVTKELAEKLGIANIIDPAKIEMINAKKLSKEAMQKLISETFMNTDAYLKENGRQELMTMILVGGWVEAQYLATRLSKSSLTENPDLVKRILEQSLTLELMLMLINDSKDNENINALQPELMKIKLAYDNINQAEPEQEKYTAFCNVIKDIRTGMTE